MSLSENNQCDIRTQHHRHSCPRGHNSLNINSSSGTSASALASLLKLRKCRCCNKPLGATRFSSASALRPCSQRHAPWNTSGATLSTAPCYTGDHGRVYKMSSSNNPDSVTGSNKHAVSVRDDGDEEDSHYYYQRRRRCYVVDSKDHDHGLPFVPQFASHRVCDGTVRAVWFEPDFCQCRYSFRGTEQASNACTLIVLLVAAKCHTRSIKMTNVSQPINHHLIKALAQSMLEGNKIHEVLKSEGNLVHVNLTVPEAISYAGSYAGSIKEWTSLLCVEDLQSTLYDNIKKNWNAWKESSHFKHHPDLYVVLICNARSVLFVIQPRSDTVTLIDSHQHTSDKGALVAATHRQKTKHLCTFFAKVMAQCYKSPKSNLYELSFLYFRRRRCRCTSCL